MKGNGVYIRLFNYNLVLSARHSTIYSTYTIYEKDQTPGLEAGNIRFYRFYIDAKYEYRRCLLIFLIIRQKTKNSIETITTIVDVDEDSSLK